MKLALGTVQFGQPYGIANTRGCPDKKTVKAILQHATTAGVRVIDTASLYGDSEEVLGHCLAPDNVFDIVTKTPKFMGMTSADAVHLLHVAFDASCAKLRTNHVYGLLAHDANDLLGYTGDMLWNEMSTLRAAGRVTKIGASVYSGAQIDALLARYPLDLVQLPLSLLDQRLVHGGQLERLQAQGVEIHARSAFLQGALLIPSHQLPSHLTPLGPYVERVAALADAHAIAPFAAALRYVANLSQITAVVCGVDGIDQFEQLAVALQSSIPTLSPAEAAACACDDPTLLDPSQWKPA